MPAAAFDVDQITATLAGSEGTHVGIRALLRELDVTLTRLDRINHGPSAGGVGGGSDEQPIPVNVAAMDASADIVRQLRKMGVAWIIGARAHVTRERIARSVHRHSTTSLAPYRWTPEDVADLYLVVKRGRLVIDIPHTDPDEAGVKRAQALALKTRLVEARRCVAAGGDLARLVSMFLEEPITAGTIRLAASQGEFFPAYKFGAHSYYTVGAVLDWYGRRQAARKALAFQS